MKNILFLISYLSILLLGTVSAEAADRYVRAGATGANNGTDWINAYASLPASLVRGDTYYIAEGSYGSRTFNTPTSGTALITIKKATVTDHGTNTGWNNTYGDGEATFTSIAFTTSYWVFDGVTGGGPGNWKTGFGFRINYTTNGPGVSIRSVTDITLRHLAIIGPHVNGTGGAASTDALYFRSDGGPANGNFTISYYYMDNLGLAPFSAIPVAEAAGSQFIAEYGYVGGFYGDGGAHSELASIWSRVHGTVTFRYNIFGYIYSTGGIMWNNEDTNARLDIYGNVFWKDPNLSGYDNCCNGVIGGWSNYTFANVHVYNNSFVNIPGAEVLSSFPKGSNTEARNNLFYNVATPGGGGGVWTTVSHNHFIQTSLIGTSSSTGSTNPFVNLTGLDFRLTAGTTAGVPLPAPYNKDMYGNDRGADGVWDRGAIEFGVGVGVTVPPTPTNLTVQ